MTLRSDGPENTTQGFLRILKTYMHYRNKARFNVNLRFSVFATFANRSASVREIARTAWAAIFRISCIPLSSTATFSSTRWSATSFLIKAEMLINRTKGSGGRTLSAYRRISSSRLAQASMTTPVGLTFSAIKSGSFETSTKVSAGNAFSAVSKTGSVAAVAEGSCVSGVGSSVSAPKGTTGGLTAALCSTTESFSLNFAEIPPGRVKSNRSGSRLRIPSLKINTIPTAAIGQAREAVISAMNFNTSISNTQLILLQQTTRIFSANQVLEFLGEITNGSGNNRPLIAAIPMSTAK